MVFTTEGFFEGAIVESWPEWDVYIYIYIYTHVHIYVYTYIYLRILCMD